MDLDRTIVAAFALEKRGKKENSAPFNDHNGTGRT